MLITDFYFSEDRDYLSVRFALTIEVCEAKADDSVDMVDTTTISLSMKYDKLSIRPLANSLKSSVSDTVAEMSEHDVAALTSQCDVFYTKDLASAIQEAFL